jgi:transposase
VNSERRHFSPNDKVAAFKRHLLEGVPVSTICAQLGIAPTLFYRWQRELFENAYTLFENGRKAKAIDDAKDAAIQQLQAKIARKNEVMAELMEAHTALKKILGNSDQVLDTSRYTRSDRRFRPFLGR